jgi:hypothetical protein
MQRLIVRFLCEQMISFSRPIWQRHSRFYFRRIVKNKRTQVEKEAIGQPIRGDEGSKFRGLRQVGASNLSSVLRPFLLFHSSINCALPAAEGRARMCETRRDE